MTREEAIKELKTEYLGDTEAIREAKDMAIEALTNVQNMHNSDLISKEDAIEAICDVVISEFDICPTYGYDVAEKALSALPCAERE